MSKTLTPFVLAVIALSGPAAFADSVALVTDSGQIQSQSQTVLGAKYRLASTNWDMSLGNQSGTETPANYINHNVGNGTSLNGVRWSMTLTHSVTEGFRFDMVRESDPSIAFTLAWGDFAGLSDDVVAPGLVNEEATLNGKAPQWHAPGMNALRIQVQSSSADPAYMAFEDLNFASSTLGNLWVGDYTANDANGTGWFWLVADANLYSHNWTLSGTYVGSGATGGGEAQKLDINGMNVVIVPLPPAAWAGLGSLALVGGLSAARRRTLKN